MVSGYCARILEAYPSMKPGDLRAGLAALAEDLGEPGFDAETGWGLLRTDGEILTPYLDLHAETEYADSVLSAVERGVMLGTGEGVFFPKAAASRAMAVTALWRMAGTPFSGLDSGFPDVDALSWYAAAVTWAASAEIVHGYDSGDFGPDDGLTGEQLAAMLYRCTNRGTEATGEEIRRWALEEELFPEPETQLLTPGVGLTRAELAAILLRYEAKTE